MSNVSWVIAELLLICCFHLNSYNRCYWHFSSALYVCGTSLKKQSLWLPTLHYIWIQWGTSENKRNCKIKNHVTDSWYLPPVLACSTNPLVLLLSTRFIDYIHWQENWTYILSSLSFRASFGLNWIFPLVSPEHPTLYQGLKVFFYNVNCAVNLC